MKPYILAETNWKQVQDTVYELAILPWGATEAHNYHLPYATDNIQCDYIAERSAKISWDKGAKVIVLPTIPFGVNTGQADIKLDINISPSTQLIILKDIVRVLNRQKIKKLLLLNGHGGNNFKPLLRELGYEFPEMFIALCDWFKVLDHDQYFSESHDDHAGEMETSLMQFIVPELVRPLEEAGDGRENVSKIKGIKEGWAWTERKWSQVTKDTGIGNPKKASKEKGEKFVRDLCDKLSTLYIDICSADLNDLYED